MRLGDANWPRDALPKGTDLHGYRLERFIGRGGFGITYRAVDGIDQVFAIKECFPRQFAVRHGMEVLPADEGDAEPLNDCLLRFTKEAKALRQLSTFGASGDGVVKVVTFFQTNRTAYLVMEYLSGRNLDDLIKHSPQGIDDATLRRILPQLLRAVGSVHAAGLLHRDIKPANILLRDNGRPVLVDFGAVRGTTQGRTATYTQIFSEGFAPIEQFVGAQQGPFSDIYALGTTLYRAIGGKTIDSFTRHQALLKGQPDPRIPASKIGAGRYGSDLLAIIDAAMIVSPEQRPQSVDVLLQMLDEELEPAAEDVTVEWPVGGSQAGSSPSPEARERDANAAQAFSVGRRRPDTSRASRAGARPLAPRTGAIVALAAFAMVVALAGWGGVAWLMTESDQTRALSEQQVSAPGAQAEADAKAAAAARAAEEQREAKAAARKASEESPASAAALEKAAQEEAAADRAEAASRAEAAVAAAAKRAAEEEAARAAEEEAARVTAAGASAKIEAAQAAAKKAAEDKARRMEADRVATDSAAAEASAKIKATEAAAKKAAEDKARRTEADRVATDSAAAEASAKIKAAEATAKKAAEDKARRTEADRAATDAAAKAAAEATAAKAAERRAASRAAMEAASAAHAQQTAQQTAQAPVTRSAYFAIARAPEKNYLAYSAMNQPTQEIADQQALQKCTGANGSGCGVYVRGYDQCVAFAFGSSFFTTVHSAWKEDADLSVARSSALKTCSDLHSSQCEIIASFCSNGE